MTLLALAFKYSSLPLQRTPSLVSIGGEVRVQKPGRVQILQKLRRAFRAVTVTFSSLARHRDTVGLRNKASHTFQELVFRMIRREILEIDEKFDLSGNFE